MDESIASLLPMRVEARYRKLGWVLFAVLVALFLAGASTLISLKYQARQDPDIKYSIRKAVDLHFPKSIMICPEELSGKITWHYLDMLSSPSANFQGDIDLGLVSINYLNWLNFDCLEINMNVSVLSTPASIQFALVWSQDLISYSDVMLILDREYSSSSWLASGLYNSSRGATNDVYLSLERYSYLPTSPPGISALWNMDTTNTDYYF